jgi:hypothetical protein
MAIFSASDHFLARHPPRGWHGVEITSRKLTSGPNNFRFDRNSGFELFEALFVSEPIFINA